MEGDENLWLKASQWIAYYFIVSGLLRVVGVILFVYDYWWWQSHFSFLFGIYPVEAWILVFDILIAFGFLLSGWGLLRKQHWARIGGIIFSVFLLTDFPIGTIVAAIFIIVLVMPAMSRVYGKFIESARPFRIAGVILVMLGVFSFMYTTGVTTQVTEELDYKINGFPTTSIKPQDKIQINEAGSGERDVVIFLTANVGTQAVRQQNLVMQDIQTLGGTITGQISRCSNAIRARMSPSEIQSLSHNSNVESIVENNIIAMLSTNIVENVETLNDVRNIVDAQELWDIGMDGDNVAVAVMDTGINPDIPAFQRNGESIVVEEYELYGDWIHWHGTAVASCIGSQDPSYPGVAPKADIIDIEVFKMVEDDYGNLRPGLSLYDALWGFDRIVEWKKAHSDYKVISQNSWGGPQNAPGMDKVTDAANKLAIYYGIIVVCAAGNNEPVLSSPSDGRRVLSVAAVNDDKEWAEFSCTGPGEDEDKKPDVSAPGVDITMYGPDGRLLTASGTSFSSPIVSGLLACIAEGRRDYMPYDYYRALQYSADDIDKPGFDYRTGYGFVDGSEAYEIIGTLPDEKSWVTISFIITILGIGIAFYPEWAELHIDGYEKWRKR